MRLLRKIATRRPISILCIVAMIIPCMAGLLMPSPAVAQVQTTRIAVVDFKNQSKVPDEMFTSMSRDAVVVEMVKVGKFDVTPTESLQSTMEKMGYRGKDERSPKIVMSASMMQQLGQELGVSSIVDGDIVSMEINRTKKMAKVRLAVRMLDVASGVLINGAVATGESHQRVGFTGDQDTDWVVEAVNDAAHKCVDMMVKYIIPEAYVLHSIDANTILLNRGSQEGVEPGMTMVVFRTGENGQDELVARVKILSVSNTDANAAVIWNARGVKPTDRARAVYEAPKYAGGSDNEGPRAKANSEKQIKTAKNWLVGAAALAGLWWLFGRGGQKAETTPGLVAVAGTSPDIAATDTGICVAWDTPASLAFGNIIEYHVYRDNISNGLAAVLAGRPNMPWNSVVGNYDHFVIDDINPRTLDYQFPISESGSYNLALGSDTMDASGLVPGDHHAYYVSTVYQRSANDAGGEAIQVYDETEATGPCYATLLNRPVAVSPGNTSGSTTVDLSKVAFQWQGSRGADQYVIEVSPSPAFTRNQTWVSGIITQLTPTNGMTVRWPATGTNDISSASELSNLAAGQQLWWRVGARSSIDKPGPYPAGPSPANGGAKSTRFIYTDSSMIYSFLNAGSPTDPPSSP